jgi:hypothetical protein
MLCNGNNLIYTGNVAAVFEKKKSYKGMRNEKVEFPVVHTINKIMFARVIAEYSNKFRGINRQFLNIRSIRKIIYIFG